MEACCLVFVEEEEEEEEEEEGGGGGGGNVLGKEGRGLQLGSFDVYFVNIIAFSMNFVLVVFPAGSYVLP